mgnify:CR=1 FL=1|jgi:hypothetical protein
MTDPRQLFHELLAEVLSYRWTKDPEHKERMQGPLQKLRDDPLSEAGLEHLSVAVAYLSAYWERQKQFPTAAVNHPVWEGWDVEGGEWLDKMEPLQVAMTKADLADWDRRHKAFEHHTAMDKGFRSCDPEEPGNRR